MKLNITCLVVMKCCLVGDMKLLFIVYNVPFQCLLEFFCLNNVIMIAVYRIYNFKKNNKKHTNFLPKLCLSLLQLNCEIYIQYIYKDHQLFLTKTSVR